jgi:hypothetical protein
MKNLLLITFALATLTLAACGGGGGGGSVPGITTTQPPPAATPAATPASQIELYPLTAAQAAATVVSPPPGVSAVTVLPMSFTQVGQIQYALAFESHAVTWGIDVGSCTGPQDVTVSSSSSYQSSTQTVLTITAAAAGDCAIYISDGTAANSAEILLDVTTTTGTISAKPRH